MSVSFNTSQLHLTVASVRGTTLIEPSPGERVLIITNPLTLQGDKISRLSAFFFCFILYFLARAHAVPQCHASPLLGVRGHCSANQRLLSPCSPLGSSTGEGVFLVDNYKNHFFAHQLSETVKMVLSW